MNVKELILSHPAVDIAAALIDRLDIEPAKSSVTLSAKKNWASFCRRNGQNTSSLSVPLRLHPILHTVSISR